MNKPRYDIEPTPDGWAVTDALATEPLAVLSSRHAAHEASMALNRGLVETITPDGRWAEEPDL